MGMIVLSMAPVPGELVAAFIRQTPGVPEFEVIAGHEMTDADLRDAAARADVILGDFTFKRRITAEIVDAARKVTLIQQPSVGYQHIDVEACTARGIRVANTAGANTESVAEHTVAWGLCLLKNMFYAHKATRQGRWEQMGVKPAELRGRVWGIVGFGRIGRAVAERLKPFALKSLLYYDTVRPERSVEEKLGAEYRGLDELLSVSDVVSLHAPLTDATRGLIDGKALAAMKQSAFLINVSRAELVDEEALAEALTQGKDCGRRHRCLFRRADQSRKPPAEGGKRPASPLAPCGRGEPGGGGEDYHHGHREHRPGAQGRIARVAGQHRLSGRKCRLCKISLAIGDCK